MKAKRTKPDNRQFEREPKVKPGPRPDFAGVHKPRDLRQMLNSDIGRPLDTDYVVLTVRHWLMDHSHFLHMERKLPEQLVVASLIADLK